MLIFDGLIIKVFLINRKSKTSIKLFNKKDKKTCVELRWLNKIINQVGINISFQRF